MAFDERKHELEEWLTLEENGMLAKICNVTDEDGLLIEQYKTRVYVYPVGVFGYSGRPSISAPSLFRAFTYDDEGNVLASIPRIREWTQDCEDLAQGAIPGAPSETGIPPGLKLADAAYNYGLAASVPAGSSVVVMTKTLLPDEAIYLRHVPVSGENRARFVVNINGSPVQAKKLWWTKFNDDLWFNTADGGILLENEEVVTVVVTNNGDDAADFEASMGFVIK